MAFSWETPYSLPTTLRSLEDIKKDYNDALAKYEAAITSEDKAAVAAELDKLAAEANNYGVKFSPRSNAPATTTIDPTSPEYIANIRRQDALGMAEAAQKGYNLQKATLGAAGASEGANLLTGIIQMAQAHHALKNLAKPQYPIYNVDTQALNDRLAQAQRLASGINPTLEREQAQAGAEAALGAKQLAKSASGGGAGLFSALMTAAHANKLENARKNELLNQQIAQGYQQDVDRLIGQKIAQDQARWEAQKMKFNEYDYPEYATQRAASLGQSALGLTNIGQSLANIPKWVNYAAENAPAWSANQQFLNQ